ncbi:lysM domain receptor-like kinase 3 [Jatropha curcas]|uniref:lysM domain receptor-like kinase 3 n=1 Tax=Jatropha curcas TaxID=180498 RepID=UPI0009D7281C|nr:lysM domain receptor-like kinase 3 [Jatropha curcas]
MNLILWLELGILLLFSVCCPIESKCTKGCDLALASYYVRPSTNLTFIANALRSEILQSPYQIIECNKNRHPASNRINVPFPCDCIAGEFLGHVFHYNITPSDTYDVIAEYRYSNLTSVPWLERFNFYAGSMIPEDAVINVTVNCSCGDSSVSKDYGLFITYPLRPEDGLSSIASQFNISADLLQRYNVGANFSAGNDLVYIPGKDEKNSYRPLSSRTIGFGVVAGLSTATTVAVVFLLAVCIYVRFYTRKKAKEAILLKKTSPDLSTNAPRSNSDGLVESTGLAPSSGSTIITLKKPVEFSYKELAQATDNFNVANKIGKGGFGSVYYAELRGEKVAIKKMDMKASTEFLAELKVLVRVHHINLVRLIGYCVERSLFLVYEYIENGNLSQHLRGSDRDPLSWSTRVQIALDSARGLEYIHERTYDHYVHCDIKPENILIDKSFQAKVGDFGLTKFVEVGSALRPARLVGTFGYMPPEYGESGTISPKADVYAFGIVLYELISGKEAIVETNDSSLQFRGLYALFDKAFKQPDPREDIRKLVDPRLGDRYPFDALKRMAQLAWACTQDDPQLRPSMESVVLALTTLS